MPLNIDGFGVLEAIARRNHAFLSIKVDVDKAASSLIIKRLRQRNLSSDQLTEIASAVGRDAFDLVIDMMSDAQVKNVVEKVDKHNPALRSETAQGMRSRLSMLANGETAPCAAPSEKSKPISLVVRSGNSRAMKARKMHEPVAD